MNVRFCKGIVSKVYQLSLYAAGFSALALFGVGRPMLEVGKNAPVGVIFSPFADDGTAVRAIADAGAPIAAIGKADWIGMSGPLEPRQRKSLTEDGALLFLNGERSAWLCSPRTEKWS